jgi:hypothetical protein
MFLFLQWPNFWSQYYICILGYLDIFNPKKQEDEEDQPQIQDSENLHQTCKIRNNMLKLQYL